MIVNIIKGPKKEIANIIGKQTYYKNKEYVPSIYQKRVIVDDGVLIENTMTTQVILLSEDEENTLSEENKKYLIENWYYVDTNVSQKSLVYAIRNSFQSKYKKNQNDSSINGFTIFTTTACNAKCPYCYEKGRKQVSMTEDMAVKVAEYIEKVRWVKPVRISWFGGEPLANFKVMNIISQYMADRKIPYSSSIISNGYLFKDHTKDEIMNLWNLKNAQITLDGTSDAYKKIKGYVDDPDDPFEVVLSNIEFLTKECGVRVSIRLNESYKNYQDLIELSKILKTRFADNKYVTVYSHPLFDDENNELTDEQWNETYDGYIALESELLSAGLRNRPSIEKMRVEHCMADSGSHICITPTGNLTMCEHHSDDEIVGNIDDGIVDTDLVESWRELADEKPMCDLCWYYPKCSRLKKCPVADDCDNGMERFWAYQEDDIIKKVYENYKERLTRKTGAVVRQPFDKDSYLSAVIGEVGKTLNDRKYWREVFPRYKERGWCVAFIYAMLWQIYGKDNTSVILRTKSVDPLPYLMAKLFSNFDAIYNTPEIGDIVFFKVNGQTAHAGIVVSISETGETFDSVEGGVLINGHYVVARVNNIPVKNNERLRGFGRPNFQNELL